MTTASGLPPMISHDDCVHRQQKTDLQEFRKYLIQSGAVKSLVKLYQHTLKNEIRIDNPNVVGDFMNKYRDEEDPQQEEREQLVDANAQLREANVALAQQFAQLEAEMEAVKKLRHKQSSVKALWALLTDPKFWATKDGMDEEKAAALQTEGITGQQLFTRLCGTLQDSKGFDLMELVRPKGLSPESTPASAAPIDPATFSKFLAEEAHEDTFDWADRVLAELLQESMDPPFHQLLAFAIQENIQEGASYDAVSNMVTLDEGLQDFLSSIINFLYCGNHEEF
eukprot:gnl/MRDRNA2_/MRDRNA2_89696_c0_seq1.p1 gnl/MRDRNA2_/MRDRNA2_89696_c0~~gnl/MRDRNA2_/MRDRNA2_89696_c0_seq1.p1  ORF type:complete len:304 (-),score=76.00 gnl/MRDRNA2_/MRDRNA2_89696_c0_seq1:145-990(-)